MDKAKTENLIGEWLDTASRELDPAFFNEYREELINHLLQSLESISPSLNCNHTDDSWNRLIAIATDLEPSVLSAILYKENDYAKARRYDPLGPENAQKLSQYRLEDWISEATKNLCPQAFERVSIEITHHYYDAFEGAIQQGENCIHAHAQAMALLGSSQQANFRFSKVYFTDPEQTFWNLIQRKPIIKMLTLYIISLVIFWLPLLLLTLDIPVNELLEISYLCLFIIGILLISISYTQNVIHYLLSHNYHKIGAMLIFIKYCATPGALISWQVFFWCTTLMRLTHQPLWLASTPLIGSLLIFTLFFYFRGHSIYLRSRQTKK